MSRVKLNPVPPVYGIIRPPGSKSLTNRAIICAALADGESQLSGVLDSEDTCVMIDAWQNLGLAFEWNRNSCELKVQGCGGTIPVRDSELFVANSGTTIRFLTAALAACRGRFRLDGVPRMRERPINDLLIGLTQLGADVQSLNIERPDCPPVLVNARGLHGGVATIAGNISSQFLSGLMMAAPYAVQDVELHVHGDLVSKPYVTMTASVMQSFGVSLDQISDSKFRIPAPQSYRGTEYAIEPDASAASYFFATAAITQGKIRVEGLTLAALQGDVAFCQVLESMGCQIQQGNNWIEVQGAKLTGVDVDMNAISDTVQTLAAVALFAEGETRIRGVAHNRHKETDRIGDLATELRKLGAAVFEHEDGLTIQPSQLRPAEIETYHDHRMAMSLALVGLRIPNVWIMNPGCTAKTYPRFFEDMAKLTNCQAEYRG